jgi:hypothetical protein
VGDPEYRLSTFWNNRFFSEICAIMPPRDNLAKIEMNLLGVKKLGKKCPPEPYFYWVVKAAA